MKTPVRHRLAALGATLILAPGLAACGFNAQTNMVYQPAIGTDVRGESTDVLGATIVSSDEGEGLLVMSLNNNSLKHADKLVKVSGSGVTVGEAIVEVAPATLLNLADQPLTITGDRIAAGNFVKLTFDFESGESLKVDVPVVGDQAPYDEITAPASPSASPSKGAAKPSASPTE